MTRFAGRDFLFWAQITTEIKNDSCKLDDHLKFRPPVFHKSKVIGKPKMNPTSNINMVIALYEEEENNLKKLISDSIEEEEFLSAKYHTTALRIVRKKLFKLNCLNEAGYQEKYHSEMKLSNLYKMLASDKNQEYKDWLIKDIELAKEKLNQLNQNKVIKESSESSNLTRETIADLLSNKIRSFSLIVDNKTNLRFQFKKKGKVLKITIPGIKKIVPDYIEYDHYALQFTKHGFIYSMNRMILTLNIESNHQYFADSLMKILSQLCIEIFGVSVRRFESFLIIDEKNGR